MNKFLSSEYVLVFLGGGIGVVSRYLVGALLELSLGSSLAGTLSLMLVNVTGALFLGIVSFHPRFASKSLKAFWGSGFAGAFTTMSGVALFLYQQGSLPITAVMFALGFLAFAAGVSFGKKKAGLEL
jgi:fluoride ion exporter CrcB/FEX